MLLWFKFMQLFQTDRFKLTFKCFFSYHVNLMINGSGDKDDGYPQTCRNYNDKKVHQFDGIRQSLLNQNIINQFEVCKNFLHIGNNV